MKILKKNDMSAAQSTFEKSLTALDEYLAQVDLTSAKDM